ncbi:MAG: DUF6491 family protein [Gammaproteobacteria bacterium]|nr:DUF6491 family protein [Gammaproteobacteria bacterium]MDH3428854.1 DUF6491 family protein [Gammaproteobacteria bacterium]MDH3434163.1 DUF6491 family protein [Gammaproteobacteria bacterium]
MKTAMLITASALITACAAHDANDSTSRQDQVQAVRDFIDVRQLEEMDAIESRAQDSWESIDDYFLIYKGRNDTYLVDFDRRCWELSDNSRIVADERWDSRRIRARFDTIRGCRIHRIYALTEAEAAELKSLGEAPGSRN